MERIFFRAIVALSLLGVLAGIPSIYLGTKGIENWPETIRGLDSVRETERKDCLSRATTPNENISCEESYQDELFAAMKIENEGYKTADRLQTFGIFAAVLVPPTLFVLFYVLRWIFTGRWRFVPTQKSGNSQ